MSPERLDELERRARVASLRGGVAVHVDAADALWLVARVRAVESAVENAKALGSALDAVVEQRDRLERELDTAARALREAVGHA